MPKHDGVCCFEGPRLATVSDLALQEAVGRTTLLASTLRGLDDNDGALSPLLGIDHPTGRQGAGGGGDRSRRCWNGLNR